LYFFTQVKGSYHQAIAVSNVKYFWTNQLGIAAVLYFFAYVLNFADGQLARLRDVISKFGRFFDPVLDGLKDLITFLAIIAYFSDSNLFILSLIGMFNVSSSIVFDWVRHTIQNRPKDEKESDKNIFIKLGIVFWSVHTRNFILVFSGLENSAESFCRIPL